MSPCFSLNTRSAAPKVTWTFSFEIGFEENFGTPQVFPNTHYEYTHYEFDLWQTNPLKTVINQDIKLKMNPNMHARNVARISDQQDLGFTWWLVWAWLNLGLGVPFVFMTLLDKKWVLASMFITLAYGVICISMLKYNRYAFVAATVLSFNPIVWIINGVYVKNRWEHQKVIAGSVKGSTGTQKISKARESSNGTSASPTPTMKAINEPSNSDYARIADEITSGNIDQGLWTRLFVETDGDENRTRARYIKARIALLTEVPPSEVPSSKPTSTRSIAAIPDDREIICLPASSLELQRNVEYGYLNKLYGGSSGWALTSQATIEGNDRIFDKLDICLTDGRTKTVWFDITQAWTKTAQQA